MFRHASRLLLLALGLSLCAGYAHATTPALTIVDEGGGGGGGGGSAPVATQTLTILGANGVAGAVEPTTDYSKDGGVTWHPAYLFTGHPWGYISGTNAWLNQDPSPFVGLNDRVDFRIRFFLPSTWTNAQMTYQVNADNEADILLNGTQLVHTVGGPISSGSLATQYLIPGINTVYVRLIDYGGWVGLNYRIDLTMQAADPIQLLTPPPSITSALSASGTVNSPFSYTTTATNSPTSFAASGLPAGLTINSATGVISGTPTAAGTSSVGLTASSNFGSGSNTLTLTIAKAAASVTLANLIQTYDGTVKSASASTSPGGLLVDFTYTGGSVPPINVGTYTVFGVVNNPNYSGTASAGFRINPAAATVALSNLIQAYDGAAKPVTVTTAPANLARSVTYNGSTTVPSAVGSYPIIATVTNPNYTGSATGTLKIVDVTAPVLSLPANLVVEATSPAGASATFAATATDNVTASPTIAYSKASGSTFALGTTTVTVTATDAAGNASSGTFTVTVRDTTAPVIAPISNLVVEAASATGAAVTFDTTASDLVSGAVAVTGSPASGSTFPLGGTTVTLSAVDAAGNAATRTFTVTVRDTTKPVITQANLVLEATSPAGAVATFAPSATDLVSGGVAVNSSIPSGSVFAVGTTAVTLTATDAAGNVATSVFSVTVTDTTAPVIAALDNLSAEATSAAGAVVTFTPSAADIVSGAVSVVATPASGSTFPLGTSTVALAATDAHGNSAASSFTVTVSDTTAPVIGTPAAITAEATSPAGAVVTFSPSASDLVDGAVGVIASPASGSTFALGTTTVALTSVDAHGNSATSSFTVTVADTTAPVLTTPASQTIEATSAAGAVAAFAASATDAVGATLAYSLAPGSTFALGTTPVNVSATDAAGNHSDGSFTITVVDTTAPVIAVPGNLVIEATSPAGAVATFTSSSSDLVDGTVAVTSSIASGSTFPVGTTAVTLTATDAHGNVSAATFSVTVTDTTAPVIAAEDNLVIEATSAAGAIVTFTPAASDLVSGAVSVTATPASGSTFALGATTVSLATHDAAGNSAASNFTVTVVDTTAPVIATPATLTAEATSATGAVVTFSPTASDLVDGAVGVTASPASGSTFPLGTSVITLTSTDAQGNTATSHFNVVVVDTTAPVIAVPADLVVEATSGAGAAVTYAATASDLVDGTDVVSFSPASGSTFALGTTPVTITSTDVAHNTATATFKVTVRDTTAPAITVPAPITAEATSASGAAISFAASATDLVDSASTVSYSTAPGSTFVIGTTTVAVTSTDRVGNTSTKSFAITVRDTIAPVINVPANLTLEATSAAGAAATFTASATDAVGAAVAYSQAPGSTFALGTTTVTVTSTDAAGNSAAPKTFSVTVRDTTKPVLTAPANLIAEATGAAGAAVNFAATVSDAVGATITYSKAPGSVFPIGTTTVTVNATDAAGNTAVPKTFTVTVRDTSGPVLSLPGNLVIEATDDDGARVMFAVSATDLVSGVRPVTVSRYSGSEFPIGVTTVTVTSRDALGNLSTSTFIVTVRDTTAPMLRLPANITAKAKNAAGARVWFSASATDVVDDRVVITYSQAPGSTFPLGTTIVTVTATDDYGNVSTGTFTVTVVDKTRPVFTKLSVNPGLLLNGTHQMVPVTVTATAWDAVDPTVEVRIVSVTSDEAITGTGTGDVGPDWQITGALTLNLRNELDPRGNGRIYTIVVTATDDSGNTRTQNLHVLVPKKSGTRFEDCDRDHRSESQRCDDEDRDCRSRDRGDDDDND